MSIKEYGPSDNSVLYQEALKAKNAELEKKLKIAAAFISWVEKDAWEIKMEDIEMKATEALAAIKGEI